jgi:hypothetical protein
MGICDFCRIECKYWEPDAERLGVGDCTVIDPMDCPANDAEDLAAIRESQARAMQPQGGEQRTVDG